MGSVGIDIGYEQVEEIHLYLIQTFLNDCFIELGYLRKEPFRNMAFTMAQNALFLYFYFRENRCPCTLENQVKVTKMKWFYVFIKMHSVHKQVLAPKGSAPTPKTI